MRNRRKKKRQAEKELREYHETEGLKVIITDSVPNCKCPYKTVEEEQAEREQTLTGQLRIIKAYMPVLLKRLSEIDDPGNPKKCKHRLTVLMLYGILTFVFQMNSRREANREMTRPMFVQNLLFYFPELRDLPHNDTLMRLLSVIDVNEIETAHAELIRNLIRKKKFRRYLIDKCYPIAIDGTQKFVRKEIRSEDCPERKIRTGLKGEKNGRDDKGGDRQYYVYVLEANISFYNGMTIPFMSEFLSYSKGDTDNSKQDCETGAFHRLADRLKKEFPRLPVMVLLDGLYPNGPVTEHCIRNGWQFMIVLKDGSLPGVWKEFEVLREPEKDNTMKMNRGNRKQDFQWVNGIAHRYDNDKKEIIFHMVVCEETWNEINRSGVTEMKTSGHARISSKTLSRENVHERCNLGARNRRGIETGILIEKRHGFNYEHCFSYDRSAMKGYHYLMRTAHLFIILAEYSESLAEKFRRFGKKGFIRFIRETIAGPWPEYNMVIKHLNRNFRLRLV